MIPFVDLQAQYLAIKPEIDAAISEVLESAQFVLGPAVAAFEKQFARFCEAKHAVGVNSGTSAIHLALLALGVGPGDEVITVPHTFVATVAAIHYCGARPVYVDIDETSYTMDPAGLEKAITPRTKAILPVHLYGQSAPLDEIVAIGRRRGLRVIEDACQAHGTHHRGQRVGGLADAGSFSFYPGKNLGAYGEGGAVVTNDDAVAERIQLLRDWGAPRKYEHLLRGYNYRLEALQAAVLGVKLRHLDRWNAARASVADVYDQALSGTSVKPPQRVPWSDHVYHVYAVRTRERARLQSFLRERGIQTGIHYPTPCHLQPAYADPAYGSGSFPVSERVASEIFSLPMFPELGAHRAQAVAAAVRDFDRMSETAA
jgi:dTDP-4-amino-4,6-dideoxygalactose transaminase